MALAPRTLFGPYEVIAQIGAGGMGEVYKARDTRLDRTVAIKILPDNLASDSQFRDRFDREARTISQLDHPHICSLYDVGQQNGTAYLVMQYLEGETLADRLTKGALPIDQALRIAIQIADALATAHKTGIVHRDLKPGNIMLTKAGAKLLDFGLAKTGASALAGTHLSMLPTTPPITQQGTILGTFQYMAPEQLEGRDVDPRTDIFALGAVIYEMVSGKKAFDGSSQASLIASILTAEPPGLATLQPMTPSSLDRVVRSCLAKDPEERWQSARDLLRELRWIAEGATAPMITGVSPVARWRERVAWALFVIAAVVLGWRLLAPRGSLPAAPVFTQLTFQHGDIEGARFGRDGHTTVYAAAWDRDPFALTIGSVDTPESRRVGVEDAALVGLSTASELAVILKPVRNIVFRMTGTLARVSLAGGVPREIAEQVSGADWAPDAARLVIAKGSRLELSDGTLLYQSKSWISDPRFSPAGDLVAFADHPTTGDDGSVVVVDMKGTVRTTSRFYGNVHGVAWPASGREVWFTAAESGLVRALHGMSLDGTTRVIVRPPVSLTLQDIAADGRALVTGGIASAEVHGALGGLPERNLSAFDWSTQPSLSLDGTTLVFGDASSAGSLLYRLFLRRAGDPSATRIADDGWAPSLSPDGRRVLALSTDTTRLRVIPTGVGQARDLERGDFDTYTRGSWMPDSRRVVFTATRGTDTRSYIQPIDGGAPTPVTDIGTQVLRLSPDGTRAILQRPDGSRHLGDLGASMGQALPSPGVAIAGWSADGSELFVVERRGWPIPVSRMNLKTGAHTPMLNLTPADITGVGAPAGGTVAANGKAYAYTFSRRLSQLYVISGLH